MNSNYHIRYLQQNEIDKAKWDNCITNSTNGLIYAYSHYLDLMSKNWDALILDNYKIVMPLTWKKKYGIHYLYQPAFTASLGVFGNDLSEEIVTSFINAIPKKFRLVEIALNQKNLFPYKAFSVRNNYILNLNNTYENLHKNFKENIKRNIKKAEQSECIIRKDIPVADVIALSKLSLQKLTNVKDEDYNNFSDLYHYLNQKNEAITYGVYSNTNELVASCVYFFSHNRAYYILVGNHPHGKTSGASHFLIDRFIYDHAGQNLFLDFEGSDIPNLALFYSGFGAEIEKYPFLKINNLPFWIKWMK